MSSGQTYEKEMIVAHVTKHGNKDPISRVEIAQNLMIPNRAMAAIIQQYKLALI